MPVNYKHHDDVNTHVLKDFNVICYITSDR